MEDVGSKYSADSPQSTILGDGVKTMRRSHMYRSVCYYSWCFILLIGVGNSLAPARTGDR